MSGVRQIPSEEELLSSTSRGLHVLYDQVQKSQENSTIVGSLLTEKDKETGSTLGSKSATPQKRMRTGECN